MADGRDAIFGNTGTPGNSIQIQKGCAGKSPASFSDPQPTKVSGSYKGVPQTVKVEHLMGYSVGSCIYVPPYLKLKSRKDITFEPV